MKIKIPLILWQLAEDAVKELRRKGFTVIVNAEFTEAFGNGTVIEYSHFDDRIGVRVNASYAEEGSRIVLLVAISSYAPNPKIF